MTDEEFKKGTFVGNPYDYPIEKLTDAVTFLAVSKDRPRNVLNKIRLTTPFLGVGAPRIEGLSEDATRKFNALRDSLDLRHELPEDVHNIVSDMCKLAFQLCEERGQISPP